MGAPTANYNIRNTRKLHHRRMKSPLLTDADRRLVNSTMPHGYAGALSHSYADPRAHTQSHGQAPNPVQDAYANSTQGNEVMADDPHGDTPSNLGSIFTEQSMPLAFSVAYGILALILLMVIRPPFVCRRSHDKTSGESYDTLAYGRVLGYASLVSVASFFLPYIL